jgi:uncharacterized membrane protein
MSFVPRADPSRVLGYVAFGASMICSHCASEMPDISVYCPGCGCSVDESRDEISTADTGEAVLGALAYIAVVPAVVFLIFPATKRKSFIRFHAWQSILFAVSAGVIALATRLVFTILSFVPFIGFLFAWLSVGVVFLAIVVLWAVLVVKASQGDAYELPWLGHFATRLSQVV